MVPTHAFSAMGFFGLPSQPPPFRLVSVSASMDSVHISPSSLLQLAKGVEPHQKL